MNRGRRTLIPALILAVLAGALALVWLPARAAAPPSEICLCCATFDPLIGEPAVYLGQFSGPIQAAWKAQGAVPALDTQASIAVDRQSCPSGLPALVVVSQAGGQLVFVRSGKKGVEP